MTAIQPNPIRTKPKTMQLGSLELASCYWLSPLAGYTTLPFRMIVRECGGLGLATTDLVNAKAVLMGSKKTMELIQTIPQDRPLAVQIYGTKSEEMRDAAAWLEDFGASVIDINMGCPVNKVTKGGGGSAMMCNVGSTVELVQKVVEGVRIPVTVKMRLGWDDQNWTAPQLAKEFEQIGVAAVIIHGRTREQGFSGQVNLEGIRAVVEAVERIPIIGNGDVRSIADAENMKANTGCAGVSIGRGALLNPWIFAQLQRWEVFQDPGEPPSYEDRLNIMSRHFHLLVQYRSERSACLSFRKVANWYCKVIKPGREVQQQLVRIDSPATFDSIVNRLREKGEPKWWRKWGVGIEEIHVPKGPISHW